MKFLLRYISIVSMFLSVCTAADQSSAAANREIFFRLSDSLMSDAAAELAGIGPVAIPAAGDTFQSYFRPLFVQGLAAKNIPVAVGTDQHTTTLELTVRESSVLYGEVFTESFFGPRMTVRRTVLKVNGTLVSGVDGKVFWTKQFSREFTDTVRYSAMEALNQWNPPLTAFLLPELSLLDSIIEPAIVTIASGVAVYLFFTIRS